MSEVQKREYLGTSAIFASGAIRHVLARVEKIAASDASVLISGESGSGKEIIARALHHHSPRAARPWVDLNCAALPEHLLESELFGHEKGAFSGAHTSKPGLFEVANRGTLFLDEIGDLDPRMQVKLLRVLDGSGYFRVGGIRKVSVDVRVVTATNQNLKTAVREGRFRADLFYRLSQVALDIPPLRERRDDILPLAAHFLAMQNSNLRFTPEVNEKLRQYFWPGNIRELRNVVMRAAILANGPDIGVDDLPEEFQQSAMVSDLHALSTTLPDLERTTIIKVLEETQGHQPSAAARLGISRRTLQRRIRCYGKLMGGAESSDNTLSSAI
jgi:DNA-binding NtrC family response regulator